MNLNNLILQHYSSLNTKNDILQKFKNNCFLKFQTTGIPNIKNENWKYTNLSKFLKPNIDFKIKSKNNNKNLTKYITDKKNCITLYNGKIIKKFSSLENKQIIFCSIEEAYKKYNKIIDSVTNYNISQYDGCSYVNGLLFDNNSLFIFVPKNIKFKPTIEILYLYDSDNDVMTNPKNIIFINKNCEVTINEKIKNIGKKHIICNSVNEIICDKKSKLDYYKIQNNNNTVLIDNNFISQKEDSNCSIHTYSISGDLIRNNIYVNLKEKNSHVNLYGISFLKKQSVVDNYTFIKHLVAKCYSNELYKGIYDENSRGVFCGKILVNKNAQKTDAFQQNNNILLSDKSKIDSKPQLEIYADDVSCSHGCTIGQIDKDALFYLQTRGLKYEVAMKMMIYGFVYDVLKKCEIPVLKNVIKNILLEDKQTKTMLL